MNNQIDSQNPSKIGQSSLSDELTILELKQAKETAEKALQFKNDYFAKLSHEIRTPLNAVIGVADALIHHHGDENISPKLEIIQSAAVSILKIMDKSLDHARLEADKCELELINANPRKTVISICELWDIKAAENNTKINCRISASVPDTLNFDQFRYEQCLNNLLSNAVKFTKNGEIDVVLAIDETDTKSPELILNVFDTGIGMTPEQQSGIFEAYSQADKTIAGRFGGTGLGLSIVKNLVTLMNGSISVESSPKKGTSFTLSIPTRQPSNNQIIDRGSAESDNKTTLENLNILVVDDNAANHFVIQALLDNKVGRIITAESGAAAISALITNKVDLILMDIHMPEMDGIQTTLAIRGSQTPWANIPIVGISADPQFHGEHMGLDIGMEGVVEKPVMYEPLIASIERALEKVSVVVPFSKALAS